MQNRATAPVVQAKGLSKRYGDFVAVDGVDFAIEAGRCFGFLGPNGAGKTTTLRMIMGLTPPTGGDLTVLGMSIREQAQDIRARVGLVPQADNLDPDFSVVENLTIYARYFGISRQEIIRRIPDLLAFASLEDKADSRTDALSGGMQRRLTIARALVNQPELVVLDEPTTGLDPQARHLIWDRLSRLREQGTTLLLTTHYMEEAERLCDELVVMDHGRILDQGSPAELIERHVEREVIELRGEQVHWKEILEGFSDCRTEQMGNSLYCYTDNARPILDRLNAEEGLVFLHRPCGLEDVFLRITGRELRD